MAVWINDLKGYYGQIQLERRINLGSFSLGVEAGGFLRGISMGNERVWKTPWMREKENVTAPCSHSIPRTQEDQNEDQAVQWVITTLSGGQGLSLAKAQERLGSRASVEARR